MQKIKVWDLFVRFFHWSVVIAFFANAFIIDDESKLHEQVGYFVLIMVLLRIFWGFVGSKYARFKSFPPSFKAAINQGKNMLANKEKPHIGHTPLGALMIYNLLITLILIGFSGWLMGTDALWGEEWPEELHEGLVIWAEISVFFHVCGVIWESISTKINLVGAMFTGYKLWPGKK